MDILKPLFKKKTPSIILITLLCISIIIFYTCYFTSNECNILNGGSIENNNKLNEMVDNGVLTDEQKMSELETNIKTNKVNVDKYNNIYNNLLTNLSSNEEEIETAEINLENAKNNLTLAEINLILKNSLILLKKHKNPKKKELLEFNVALNRSKQYNIQTIISFQKTKQLRKNTLKSPKDSFFKTELLNSLEESIKYSKHAHTKAKHVYTLCISSSNPEIIKYKNNLNNSKNLAKNLEDNIINIKNRIDEKYNIQDSIKQKLLIQPTPSPPTTEQPTTEQPPTEQPTTEQPPTKQPDIEQSTTEQIDTEQLDIEQSTIEQTNNPDSGIIDTISNLINF